MLSYTDFYTLHTQIFCMSYTNLQHVIHRSALTLCTNLLPIIHRSYARHTKFRSQCTGHIIHTDRHVIHRFPVRHAQIFYTSYTQTLRTLYTDLLHDKHTDLLDVVHTHHLQFALRQGQAGMTLQHVLHTNSLNGIHTDLLHVIHADLRTLHTQIVYTDLLYGIHPYSLHVIHTNLPTRYTLYRSSARYIHRSSICYTHISYSYRLLITTFSDTCHSNNNENNSNHHQKTNKQK